MIGTAVALSPLLLSCRDIITMVVIITIIITLTIIDYQIY